jgi:RimJ/RimL family protein N-acetyltransferase
MFESHQVASLPTFQTTRLTLRPRTVLDLPTCWQWIAILKSRDLFPDPADPELHEEFVGNRIEADYGKGHGYWSVFARTRPEEFLGWILLIPRDGDGPGIEIGWRFVREAWDKGFAIKAARPGLDHAFQTLGLRSVVADIHPANTSSMKVAAKIGMRDMGVGVEAKFLGVRS